MTHTTRSTSRRSMLGVTGLAVSAVLLAACSSGSGGGATTSPAASSSSASASESATATESPTAPANGIEAARAEVAANSAPIESWPQPTALSKPVDLTGKTIWWIPIGNAVPVINGIGTGFTEGVEKAGGKVKLCDGKFNPADIGGCMKAALDQKADAVVTAFIDYGQLPNAYDALVAAGIPVLVAGVPPTGGKTNSAELAFLDPSASRKQAFEFLSKIAIADGGESTNILWAALEDSSLTTQSSAAGAAIVTQICPTCTVVSVPFSTPTVDKLPAGITAALVKNPNINYVIVPVDAFVPPVTAGIQAANAASKVKLISSSGDVAGLQLVQAGKMLADTGTPVIYEGWLFANALMQLLAGDTVTPEDTLVQRTFTKENTQDLTLTPEAYLTSAWYGNEDFKTQYATAWGLK